jgi:DNA repair protein RadA/Sms
MLLAVLETSCRLVIGGRGVYLDLAGGLRIAEPAADLAVAAARVSFVLDRPVPRSSEVGISGSGAGGRPDRGALAGSGEARVRAGGRGGGGRGSSSAASEGLRIQEIRRLSESRDLPGDHGAAHVVGGG